jgi:hypothetical protein
VSITFSAEEMAYLAGSLLFNTEKRYSKCNARTETDALENRQGSDPDAVLFIAER